MTTFDSEAMAQELYAGAMADNAEFMARYTPEQQEAARVGTLKRCREYVANLEIAIERRDVDAMLKAIHRHNANSRKVFKAITGIDAGKTDKSCREAIKQHVGAEFFEQHLNESTAKAADREAAFRKQQDDREREAELGRRTTYQLVDGQIYTATVREMIDHLFTIGFRPEAGKRGFAKMVKLRRPGESTTLRTKYAMAYALEKAAGEAVTT